MQDRKKGIDKGGEGRYNKQAVRGRAARFWKGEIPKGSARKSFEKRKKKALDKREGT